MEKSEVAKIAALTAGVSVGTLMKTAIEDHRIWTHQSLRAEPSLEKGFRIGGSHLTDTKRWACVHRIHHSTPDANLVPFIEVADYLDWRENQQNKNQIDSHPIIPDEIEGLDPVLSVMETGTVRLIGATARQLVEGKYKPDESYDISEAHRILTDSKPRFLYEDNEIIKIARTSPIEFDKDNLPSLQDMRFMLRDPHSPALHRKGVIGILKYNVPLYKYVERSFADPEFRPIDLIPDELDLKIRENRAKIRIGYVALMSIAAVAINKPNTPKKITSDILLGSIASGVAVVALIAGGNITNAFGHAGDLSKTTISDFMKGKVHPKADGTYTSNNLLLGLPTLDEVGGQEDHHRDPSLIAYSSKKGLAKFAQAPFGSILELLVSKNVFIKKGKNFKLNSSTDFGSRINLDKLGKKISTRSDHRPDDPSEAVMLVQKERQKFLSNS